MSVNIEQLMGILDNYIIFITLGLSVLICILIVLVCMQGSRLKKIQAKYEKFMSKEDIDLEELLVQYTKKLNTLIQGEEEIKNNLKKIEDTLGYCVQKVGIIRYQAIQNMGGDLSFAIALLDQSNSGVVLNGIYSRDGSYTYAKPIEQGKSKYNLSEEEEEAIAKAINGENENKSKRAIG